MKINVTPEKEQELLSSYVESPVGCWEWTGPQGTGGYATLKSIGAHRVSYTLHKGPIPIDRQIDHLCSNRICINPHHLDAVTISQDSARKKIRNRWRGWATHCKAGHELNDETTLWKLNGQGRQCRVCQYERQREYWARQGKPAKSSKGLRKNPTLKNKHLFNITTEEYDLADFDERFLEVFFACDDRASSSVGCAAGKKVYGKYQLPPA